MVQLFTEIFLEMGKQISLFFQVSSSPLLIPQTYSASAGAAAGLVGVVASGAALRHMRQESSQTHLSSPSLPSP